MLLLALLVAGFVVCAWWHIHENLQIAKDYKGKIDWQMERWLLRFSWSRSLQFLFVLACAIAIVCVYTQPNGSNTSLPQFHTDAVPAPIPAPAETAPAPVVTPTPVPAPAAQAPTPAPVQPAPTGATQKALDTVISGSPVVILPAQQPAAQPAAQAAQPKPQPAPAAVPAPAPAAKPTAAQTMDEVYNPEKKAGDAQSSMDDIKKRYEDILVIYMFLKKCNKAKDADYNVILSSLGQEMASVNAPGRMQYDILTSAQGSYKELYSKSSCTGNGIDSLVRQYTDYIKVLSKNVAPH